MNSNIIYSVFSSRDWTPSADPLSPDWVDILPVLASGDFYGVPTSLRPTEVRSRWTAQNLYLLYTCPYHELYLKPSLWLEGETDALWECDVAEAFIGCNFDNISLYKEFQVSPRGEYVDLAIDRDHPDTQPGVAWWSGFTVAGCIDERKKIWYGEMCIPWETIDVRPAAPGNELRLGLFRIEGPEPNRTYVSWQPTGEPSFHVPAKFGRLVLK